MASVFTHMQWEEVCHYLQEISRVLKPGGVLLATCFLINEKSWRLISEGASSLSFKPYGSHQYVVDEKNPEAAIAFSEPEVHEQMRRCYLQPIEPTHYGSWCGRRHFLSFQDVLVARKPLLENAASKSV